MYYKTRTALYKGYDICLEFYSNTNKVIKYLTKKVKYQIKEEKVIQKIELRSTENKKSQRN